MQINRWALLGTGRSLLILALVLSSYCSSDRDRGEQRDSKTSEFGAQGETAGAGHGTTAGLQTEARSGTASRHESKGSQSLPADSQPVRDDRIYIDSVPRGATVILVPREGESGEEVEIGKTPLVVDPSATPSMRFLIMMTMDDYLNAIEPLADLTDWAERFKATQHSGRSFSGHQDWFHFEDTPDSRVVQSMSGGLVGVGPVYTLEWPRHHRLVALFVPKGVNLSTLYPLMPPRGTFELYEEEYGASLVNDYGFSPEQRHEAVGALSRCGKYVTKVKGVDGPGTARLYSISAQHGYFISSIAVVRVIPGFND